MKRLLTIAFALLLTSMQTTAQTWWPQNSTVSTNLKSISFYDDNFGFSFGDTLSTVVKTNVSGTVWNELNPVFTAGDLRSSVCLSPSKIIAVGAHDVNGGKGLMLTSIDSGNTWIADTTSFTEELMDIDFAGSSGYTCGRNGKVYRSGDGGSTWNFVGTVPTTAPIYSIDFPVFMTGWVVGGVDTSAIIYRSEFAGSNWIREPSGITDTLYSVFFYAGHGWAVGENGTILTTIGGYDWDIQTSGTTNNLYDVWFIDGGDIGWVVGENGTVLKSIDGGITWNPENSGTTVDIHSISMYNETLGWLCGDSGVVRVYGYNPPWPSRIHEVETNGNEITLYPNPAINQFTVSGLRYPTEISLFDITGRRVLSQIIRQGESVAVSHLPKGLYLWQVGKARGKIVLN